MTKTCNLQYDLLSSEELCKGIYHPSILPMHWSLNTTEGAYDIEVFDDKPLPHLSLDKMATISQVIFSDASLWMKSFVFWLKFEWSLFLRVQLKITSIGFDNGLALNRRQAIMWTNADLIHWHIYGPLGGDELKAGFTAQVATPGVS